MIILSEDYTNATIPRFLSISMDCVTYLGGCGEFRKVCRAVAKDEETHVFLDAPRSGKDWRVIKKQLEKDAARFSLHTIIHTIPCSEYYLVQWLVDFGFHIGICTEPFQTEEQYFKLLLHSVCPACGVINEPVHGKLYDADCDCCTDTAVVGKSMMQKSQLFASKCTNLVGRILPEKYTITTTDVLNHKIKHIQ